MQDQTYDEKSEQVFKEIKDKSATFIGLSGILLTIMVNVVSVMMGTGVADPDSTMPNIVKLPFIGANFCLILCILAGITVQIETTKVHPIEEMIDRVMNEFLFLIGSLLWGLLFIGMAIMGLLLKSETYALISDFIIFFLFLFCMWVIFFAKH